MLKIRAANLALPGVAHTFFGRSGGVSNGIYASLNCGPGSGDDRDNVLENRRRAMDALAPSAMKLLTLYQVHGRETATVREPWEIGYAPKADASATALSGVALGILTADCAPVLLADAEARVIGAAHAGWKGALAGVIETAVAAMERLGAGRDRTVAAIGPCISQASYEVGNELRAALEETQTENRQFFITATRSGHLQFDLGGFVRAQLHRAGIEKISTIPACTYRQESDFFSYRRATHRAEPDYGRQLSAIVLL